MKTSFYFVVWILIYPVLGLLDIPFVRQQSFLVALLVVWGISWALNRAMPHILYYERVSHAVPVMEDIYTGNVGAISRRLSRHALVDTITAVYFTVSTVVLAMAVFLAGANNWFALIIFALFTVGAITRSVKLFQAKAALDSDPSPQRCMEIATEAFKLNYAPYYEGRSRHTYAEMLPQKPRNFTAFQVFSLVIAGVAAVLGLLYIASAISTMFARKSIEAGAVAGIYFLYGSLAAYFGIKDIISIVQSFKKRRAAI